MGSPALPPHTILFIMFRVVLLSALVAVALSVGGWSEGDINDVEYSALLEEVYYPVSIGAENLHLIKIETQLVSGVNYKYTFTVGNSNSMCYVIIYHQPWTQTKRIMADTCAF